MMESRLNSLKESEKERERKREREREKMSKRNLNLIASNRIQALYSGLYTYIQ